MAQESILQSKILGDLESLGKNCVAFKIMKANVDGVPDVFFTTKVSGPVLVELKAPDGVISDKQRLMIQWLNECGCKAFECWSIDDWFSIKKQLGI